MELAIALAMSRRERNIAVGTLNYARDAIRVLLRDKGGPAAELDSYYALFNLHHGTNYSADSVLRDQVKAGISRYEQLTGMRMDSAEMDAAIDYTIKCMGT